MEQVFKIIKVDKFGKESLMPYIFETKLEACEYMHAMGWEILEALPESTEVIGVKIHNITEQDDTIKIGRLTFKIHQSYE